MKDFIQYEKQLKQRKD